MTGKNEKTKIKLPVKLNDGKSGNKWTTPRLSSPSKSNVKSPQFHCFTTRTSSKSVLEGADVGVKSRFPRSKWAHQNT